MKKESDFSKQFTVQFVFIMLLFLTIVVLSVTIINLGKNVYNGINDDRSDNYQLRVSLSYLATKVRQADLEDRLDLKSVDGEPALVIKEIYDESIYETWIYYHDGALYEFFSDEGTVFDATDGMEILKVASFEITKLKDNLFKFKVTSQNNSDSAELVLSLTSQQQTNSR